MLLNFKSLNFKNTIELNLIKASSYVLVFIENGQLNIKLNPKEDLQFSTGILLLNNKNIDRFTFQSVNCTISMVEIDELFMSDFLIDIHSLNKQYQFVKLDHEECFYNVLSIFKMMQYEIELNHINTVVV